MVLAHHWKREVAFRELEAIQACRLDRRRLELGWAEFSVCFKILRGCDTINQKRCEVRSGFLRGLWL